MKRSREYATISGRVIGKKPSDTWQANMLHYFVFEFDPDEADTTDRSYALFTMRWDDDDPVSALIITADDTGEKKKVANLRDSTALKISRSGI